MKDKFCFGKSFKISNNSKNNGIYYKRYYRKLNIFDYNKFNNRNGFKNNGRRKDLEFKNILEENKNWKEKTFPLPFNGFFFEKK